MSYCDLAAVHAKILTSVLTIGPISEPFHAAVNTWIEATSSWMDASLASKYQVRHENRACTPQTAAQSVPGRQKTPTATPIATLSETHVHPEPLNP